MKSYAFTVPKAGESYYFGDLTFSGRKRFDTIGGANIRDVVAHFQDNFDHAKSELMRRNPQLHGGVVGRLMVRDVNDAQSRAAVYVEALDAGHACCSKLSDLKYQKLQFDETYQFVLGERSELFDFATGRSRLLAWELPRSSGPVTVSVRSIVTPSGIPGRFYVFSPAVMLLDDNFNVIAGLENGLFGSVPASLMPPRAASLQGQIQISGQYAAICRVDRIGLGLLWAGPVVGHRHRHAPWHVML